MKMASADEKTVEKLNVISKLYHNLLQKSIEIYAILTKIYQNTVKKS